jgi:hypothetical protein
VFALLSDRNPWRALDDALAAALSAHEAVVRADERRKAVEELLATPGKQPHIHTAHPETGPYRLSGCGQPYLLETL